MTDTENTTLAGNDGRHEFTIDYSGREVPCIVEKSEDRLTVHIEDNITAELQIEPDGTLHQTSGNTIPDSVIEFIKKNVLGHEV